MQLDPTNSSSIHNIQHQEQEAPIQRKTTGQSIKEAIGKIGDSIHRFGITMAGALPFSSRGIILNLTLALIPIRMIQSTLSQSKFTDKMKQYMDRDWNGGISDTYINLESSKNSGLRKQVVEDNFRYAGYMYAGCGGGNINEFKNGRLLSTEAGYLFPKEKEPHLTALKEKLTEVFYYKKQKTKAKTHPHLKH